MDPSLVIAITSISAVSLGLLTKLLFILRKNVKYCCGITFRSVGVSEKNSQTDSPRMNQTELNQIKHEIKKVVPQNRLTAEQLKIHDLEIKLHDAQAKIKDYDVVNVEEVEISDDRVYI